MSVFALQRWKASKSNDGTFTLTSWQSPANVISGFATGKKTEKEVKDKKGNMKKVPESYEHRFVVKKVEACPAVGGWTTQVTNSEKKRFSLCLGVKNRFQPPPQKQQKIQEKETVTPTPTESTEPTEGDTQTEPVPVVPLETVQSIEELDALFGTTPPPQQKEKKVEASNTM